MKVIFLDRDGIVNRERDDYTWLPEQFEFTANLFDFLRKAAAAHYHFIIITNQGGIDKGIYTTREVEILHEWMLDKLTKEGIEILDVYFCPHHSDVQKCLCRKPSSLLIEKACANHPVDKSHSFMIGDRERDIVAAQSQGIEAVLLESNPDWNKVELKYVFNG